MEISCMQHKKIVLNNNEILPYVGLGTYSLDDHDKLEEILTWAIELGYRHFDTSPVYNNEAIIGEYFAKVFESGKLKRCDVKIGTKLWNDGHECVTDALEGSLSRLRMSYVDYFYVHWPVKFQTHKGKTITDKNGKPKLDTFDCIRVWIEMERQFDYKRVRCIALSNYGKMNLSMITELGTTMPQLLQIECHPYWKQRSLIRACNESCIAVVASCPLGGDDTGDCNLKRDPIICDIAQRTGMSPVQVILSYTTMRGLAVIPRASNYKELKENITFRKLSIEDFDLIDNIETAHKFYDPVHFGENRFE